MNFKRLLRGSLVALDAYVQGCRDAANVVVNTLQDETMEHVEKLSAELGECAHPETEGCGKCPACVAARPN
jgi:hypothetical protein